MIRIVRQLIFTIHFWRWVLQHLEVMAWCARHQFLETIRSSYDSITQWQTSVKERKFAAQGRAWLETPHNNGKLGVSQPATLFIEEALANLGLLEDDADDEVGLGDLPELGLLREGPIAQTPASLRFRRDMESTLASLPYPPESVRAAVDLLFLDGPCDLILAKKAIVSFMSSLLWCIFRDAVLILEWNEFGFLGSSAHCSLKNCSSLLWEAELEPCSRTIILVDSSL